MINVCLNSILYAIWNILIFNILRDNSRKILSNFKNLCKSNGVMFFEIGAEQAQSVLGYAEICNLYAECIKDYSGNDRVIIVRNSKRGN